MSDVIICNLFFCLCSNFNFQKYVDAWMSQDPFSYAEWFNPDQTHLPDYISFGSHINISNSLWLNTTLEPVTRHDYKCTVAVFNTLRTPLNMKRIPCNQDISNSFAVCETEALSRQHLTYSNIKQPNMATNSYLLNKTTLRAPMCQHDNAGQIYEYCVTDVDRQKCQYATMGNTCLDFFLQSSDFCLPHQFQCNDGMCISLNLVCDGEADCKHREDEDLKCNDEVACSVNGTKFDFQYCRHNCLIKEHCICTDSYFQCLSGGCIRVNQFCDKKHDCKDKSDELECVFPSCKASQFTCDNMECIPLSWYCNTFKDCADGSDELNCTSYHLHRTIKLSTNNNMPLLTQCGEDNPDFIYASSMCILVYDHYGAMEGCTNGWHLQNCSESQCIGYFKCNNSYCIPISYICDGKNDCPDREDEIACEMFVCPGLYRCKATTICISQSSVCDGTSDCPDKDDEDNCYTYLCPEHCICNNYQIRCSDRSLLKIPSVMTNQVYIIFKGNALILQNDTLLGHYKLQVLDISFNKLELLPPRCFDSLHSLVVMNLSNNNLRYLEPFINYRLQTIDISNNSLQKLTHDLFVKASILNLVVISNNMIHTIEEHIFGYIKLDILDVRLNAISVGNINIHAFDLVSHIDILYVDDQHLCCYVPRYGSCIAPTQALLSCDQLLNNTFIRTMCWFFGAVSTIINAFSIYLQTNSYLSRKNNITLLIVNLHFSELCMGIYLLTISIIDNLSFGSYYVYHYLWSRGILCKALSVIHMYSIQNSATLVMFLALLRFFVVVVLPMQKITLSRGTMLLSIFIITASNIAVCVTHVNVGSAALSYARSRLCVLLNIGSEDNGTWRYFTTFYVTSSMIFLLIAGIAYVLIFRAVYKTQCRSGRKKKRLPWFSLLVLSNIFCYLPLLCVTMLDIFGVRIHENVSSFLIAISIPLNSIVNPFIYTFSMLSKKRLFGLLRALRR